MDPLEEAPWADTPQASASQPDESQSSTATAKSATPSSASRASRLTPRRLVAQPTRLQAVEDDPLGSLGDAAAGPLAAASAAAAAAAAESPPVPPLKEQPPLRTTMPAQQQAAARRGPADPHHIGDDDDDDGDAEGYDGASRGPRVPPPVVPAQPSPVRSSSRPSVSVEMAAKPSFQITVGDPHKVGSAASSHIEYSVRTKVSPAQHMVIPVASRRHSDGADQASLHTQTTSKGYKLPEFVVNRRYRDFLWLYNTLHANNPGVVVPPPPEKQAMGRFETNFVEARRAALEKMLNKTAAHPMLQHDADLKLFLESEAFNVDVKHKERKEPSLEGNKGMLSSLGINVGGSSKFVEQDDVGGQPPPPQSSTESCILELC